MQTSNSKWDGVQIPCQHLLFREAKAQGPMSMDAWVHTWRSIPQKFVDPHPAKHLLLRIWALGSLRGKADTTPVLQAEVSAVQCGCRRPCEERPGSGTGRTEHGDSPTVLPVGGTRVSQLLRLSNCSWGTSHGAAAQKGGREDVGYVWEQHRAKAECFREC